MVLAALAARSAVLAIGCMWDPTYNRGGILNENASENAPRAEKPLLPEKTSQSPLASIRIVLVEPSHPGNIGGAARAMKTMGLSDLVLVNPGRYPDPQAEWRAAGAQDVLESTRVCDSVEAAIEDAQWVVGTSTRVRRIPWPLMKAEEAVAGMIERLDGQQIAVLIEADGLRQHAHTGELLLSLPEIGSLLGRELFDQREPVTGQSGVCIDKGSHLHAISTVLLQQVDYRHGNGGEEIQLITGDGDTCCQAGVIVNVELWVGDALQVESEAKVQGTVSVDVEVAVTG